jgi:hypothetical protein
VLAYLCNALTAAARCDDGCLRCLLRKQAHWTLLVVESCNFQAKELSERDYIGVKVSLELPVGGELSLVCGPFASADPFTTHHPLIPPHTRTSLIRSASQDH